MLVYAIHTNYFVEVNPLRISLLGPSASYRFIMQKGFISYHKLKFLSLPVIVSSAFVFSGYQISPSNLVHGLQPISKLQYLISILVLRAKWVWQAWGQSKFVPKNWFEEAVYRGCMFCNIMNKGCVGSPVVPIPLILPSIMFHLFFHNSLAPCEPKFRFRVKCCRLYFINFKQYAHIFNISLRNFAPWSVRTIAGIAYLRITWATNSRDTVSASC